jgi:phenylacetate-coenzyme A ligase PaaK-like adenylate-forming protein
VLGTGGHYVGAAWLALEQRRGGWRSRGIRVCSVQEPLGELVAELQAFDPVMLTGYPSALDLLAGEQSAGRLALKPVTIELGGESFSPETQARISAAFGCPVRHLYAASECQSIAYSCNHGWQHLNTDWVILEPVNEGMRPTPPGEFSHTVLLTNLANRVQPIVRYDLGDSVMVRPEPCPCGCALPAIRVAGRRDDVLRLHDAQGHAVKIPPLAIGAVFDETRGVRRGQIIQTGPATIQLRLEPEADVDVERTWRDVTANLIAYLSAQHLANVALIRNDEPPRHSARFGKFRQVIVDSGNASAAPPP